MDMEVFREIFQICPRLPNQDFDELPSDKEIVSFIKELGHKGDIKSIAKVVLDHIYQPWRTFAAIINKCLSGKITDFTFQIESRDHNKQEKIYYPRFTKAIIDHFITKDMSISMRNKMFMHTAQDDSILGTMRFVSKFEDFQIYGVVLPNRMTNQQIWESDAYKTYLTYATGATSPKLKRELKKFASPSKKRTFVTVEEEETEPAKKAKKAPAKAERSKGIELLSDATLLEEAQLKKALRRSKRETTIHQAGGSSEGADSESKVCDEPKGKSTDTSKGTGLKPGVPDVSEGDSSKSEYESWGDSGDKDADDQQGDDERTESDDEPTETDNPKTSDDEEEIQDDKFVHTPEDYVLTDDKSNDVTEEEYERINEELYGDVNVSLTYVESAEKKDDAEMTVASHVNVNQEGVATTSTTVVPNSETLTALHQRITDLEKDVKELKDVDKSSKVIQKNVADIIKEHFIPAKTVERLGQQYAPQKSVEDIREIKMEHARKQQVPKETITLSDTTALEDFDLKTTLFETMTKSKSFIKSPKQRALYHALMESILEDEDAMAEGVAKKLKKRKSDDADKDEGPSAGSD
ncbi:hypothetical protein Tco_0869416 [Tanacetum coccineum]